MPYVLEGKVENLKLSVLTTIFNGEPFIKDVIDSVLNQTFKNFEWIIIDDGSTDNTWNLLKQIDDERVRIHKLNTNHGVGFASNIALKMAKGEYIAKVDVDDIYVRDRFKIQVDFLDSNPDIDVIDSFVGYFPHDEEAKESSKYKYCQEIYSKYINRALTSKEIHEELYWGCIVINSVMMARKKIVLEVGYSDEMSLAEDYHLFYKLNEQNVKFFKIPTILANVRIRKTSTTMVNSDKSKELTESIKENFLINYIKKDTRPLFIWGAGSYGENILFYLEKKLNIKVEGFVDSNPDLDRMKKGDKTIFYFNNINLKNYKVIVASTYKCEIVDLLRKKDLKANEDFYVM